MAYVGNKPLDFVQARLKTAGEVTLNMILPLMYPEYTANEEMMVPLDMRVVEQEFEDPAQMMRKLGPPGRC